MKKPFVALKIVGLPLIVTLDSRFNIDIYGQNVRDTADLKPSAG